MYIVKYTLILIGWKAMKPQVTVTLVNSDISITWTPRPFSHYSINVSAISITFEGSGSSETWSGMSSNRGLAIKEAQDSLFQDQCFKTVKQRLLCSANDSQQSINNCMYMPKIWLKLWEFFLKALQNETFNWLNTFERFLWISASKIDLLRSTSITLLIILKTKICDVLKDVRHGCPPW